MNANLEQIKAEILAGAEELTSSKEVYEFKKKFLDGKTGKIGLLMREMKNIAPEERAAYGKGVNELKEWALEFLGGLDEKMKAKELQARYEAEKIDISLPAVTVKEGNLHPITLVRNQIIDIFAGMGFAALFKFIIDGLKLVSGEISFRVKGFAGEIGTQIYPAVMSVGYICGFRISSYMFAGGVLSWLVLIPLIVMFGENAVIYPSDGATIGEIFAADGASGIWGSYIRYIGAGALAAGGIISLIKSLPLIIRTFKDALKSINVKDAAAASVERTSNDLNMKVVLIAIAILTLAVWLIPAIPVNLLGALIIVIFGFFFATVSSRMVGLVGSSNNPVSGMAIATLLIATLILKFTGASGAEGMAAAIAIGSIICIVAAISGDTSQDLKTGYLLGSTPKKQQIGEIIGVCAAALAIGGTLYLLDSAWGFGSAELGAPQATLMKMIIEGVMSAELPWNLVFVGVFIAVLVEVIGIPVLPFAIGVYLPVQLNACILIGGIVRLVFDKMKKKEEEEKKEIINDGILFCSGMIAGEGLVGIVLALLAVFGVDKVLDISGKLNLPPVVSSIGSLVVFGLIICTLLKFSIWKKRKKADVKNEA